MKKENEIKSRRIKGRKIKGRQDKKEIKKTNCAKNLRPKRRGQQPHQCETGYPIILYNTIQEILTRPTVITYSNSSRDASRYTLMTNTALCPFNSISGIPQNIRGGDDIALNRFRLVLQGLIHTV